jgi:mono/diheme cytochrome c family protein
MDVRVATFALPFALCIALAAQTAPSGANAGRSVWSGVYTAEQAALGMSVFENNCAECHLSDLTGRAGPPLKGDDFMEHWRGKTVGGLFEKIKTTMPADWRTQLNDTRALNVVSFLLEKNGFPAGPDALTIETAASAKIEEQQSR